MTTVGGVSAALSLGLFGLVFARFFSSWVEDWRTALERGPEDVLSPRPGPGRTLRVFGGCLAFQLAVHLFVYGLCVCLKGQRELREALEFWTCADSRHYLDIARDGYLSQGPLDRLVQLVFLPGYPLAVRAAARLTGDYLSAGLLVSALSFAGAGTMLYRLARLDGDEEHARRTVRFLCLTPGSFFFAAPMSESLFLLLSLGCVYLARREKWLPACLLGGLGAFTRSVGLALIVPVGYELVTRTLRRGVTVRRVLGWGALLLIPAGFGAYCLLCRTVSGDPFQWVVYQREHWGQRPGWFFRTAAYQLENAVSYFQRGDYHTAAGLWTPNLLCAFGSLGAMVPAARRLRPGYTAYYLAYFLGAMGATWLLSAPRYLTVLFPVTLALADLARDRRADTALTILLTGGGVLYLLMFVARWQVW